MPQPWDQDQSYRKNGTKRNRPSIGRFIGKITEIFCFSVIVYAAVLKHHYNVNRKNK